MADTERRQICQQCRSPIDARASRCPECGKRPYPLQWWVTPVFIVGGLAVLVLVVWFAGRV